MADPVTEISDRNGVSQEEALFYLQEFKWDFNSAMEACRNQTLSPFTDDDESSPEFPINVKFASSTPPKTTDTVRIPNSPENQQPPPQSRNELTRRFADAIDGTTPHDAVEYLTRSNWNIHVAVGEFLDERRSGSMVFDKTKSIKEALMAVSQANVESITPGTIQESSVPMVIDWNQLPRPREQLSQLNDTLIDSFLGFVGGATREEAITCLKLCDWDVNEAAYYFFDRPSFGVFSEEETVKATEMNWQDNRGNQEAEIGNSSSSLNADPTEIGRLFNEAGLVNVPVAVSGIARSQVVKNWNSEAVDEDRSTETGPDPLATQDTNIVEPRADIIFQVLLADGRNGTEEIMSFRSDETVRDIRNRIAELRPDERRDYYLTSLDDEIYDDLNTTVQRIHSRGARKLLQVLSDSS